MEQVEASVEPLVLVCAREPGDAFCCVASELTRATCACLLPGIDLEVELNDGGAGTYPIASL